MKKFIPLLILILLAFSGCANVQPEQQQPDTTANALTGEPATSTNSVTDNSSVTIETSTTTQATDSQQISSSKTTLPKTTLPQSLTSAPTTQANDSSITVTVYCSCKNAVIYGIRNKGDYASSIPADGVLFNSTVTVKKGSTAMDAIKSACRQNNIQITEKRGYISSIGGLSEKDCGGSSGWMYCVNAVFPYVSSDKYTLNPGDRIELHYTVKNGDVS